MNIAMEHKLIGSSARFDEVLRQIEIVAPTDCAVLIQGETGTGKEVVAKAIHEQSHRAGGPFVKINCAAIPSGLLESELFGHERGAFTGAVTQTIGRFELAHRGTLFLDEIGDLPLELQPKLLRVLQEQEFERLGSVRTTRVDVRIIAASNQDLEQMVDERRFRADLFYRLSVFPILLPALRERLEDIPLLARHFVQAFAHRMNKSIESIPNEVMEILKRYNWPGNIRELQNFLERSVLMTRGSTLQPPLNGLPSLVAEAAGVPATTLAEVECAHIKEALRQTNWVVGGRNGAAAVLGLPRTTLLARMQRHGIGRAPIPFAAIRTDNWKPDTPERRFGRSSGIGTKGQIKSRAEYAGRAATA